MLSPCSLIDDEIKIPAVSCRALDRALEPARATQTCVRTHARSIMRYVGEAVHEVDGEDVVGSDILP